MRPFLALLRERRRTNDTPSCRHSFRPHTELALHELWFSDDRSAVKVCLCHRIQSALPVGVR